jgi:hypothetical protein
VPDTSQNNFTDASQDGDNNDQDMFHFVILDDDQMILYTRLMSSRGLRLGLTKVKANQDKWLVGFQPDPQIEGRLVQDGHTVLGTQSAKNLLGEERLSLQVSYECK